MERTWACFDCRFNGAEPICCRADGSFDPMRVARILLKVRTTEDDGSDAKLSRMQAYDCVDEMMQVAPDAALAFILVALDICRTREQVALLAAGSLETLLRAHGQKVIGPLEEVARHNAKMRYFLSSTWGQGSIPISIWRRLIAAIADGPVMDANARTPAAGLDHLVLPAEDVISLLTKPLIKDAVE